MVDVLLYGDLVDPFFPVAREGDGEKELDQSSEDQRLLAEMRQKVSELSEQNSALRKNISCLFKTAKLELGRKNTAITSLEKRVEMLQAVISHTIHSKAPAHCPPHSLTPAVNQLHRKLQPQSEITTTAVSKATVAVRNDPQKSRSHCVGQKSTRKRSSGESAPELSLGRKKAAIGEEREKLQRPEERSKNKENSTPVYPDTPARDSTPPEQAVQPATHSVHSDVGPLVEGSPSLLPGLPTTGEVPEEDIIDIQVEREDGEIYGEDNEFGQILDPSTPQGLYLRPPTSTHRSGSERQRRRLGSREGEPSSKRVSGGCGQREGPQRSRHSSTRSHLRIRESDQSRDKHRGRSYGHRTSLHLSPQGRKHRPSHSLLSHHPRQPQRRH